MSRDNAHPALHTPNYAGWHGKKGGHGEHFVPEGWEDLDRGICPCGEVVVWEPGSEKWVIDRQMRVLVLSATELKGVVDMFATTDSPSMIQRQLLLQDEVEAYEASND